MKKIASVIIACIFLILCSCGNDGAYKTYACTLHDCLGKEYSLFWNISENEDLVYENMPTKTLLVNQTEICLDYYKTIGGGLYRSSRTLDRYCDSSGTIWADFRSSDGKMIRLSVEPIDIDINKKADLTEEEWKNKAVGMISLYAETDSYQFVSRGQGQNGETVLNYAKYVGDIKTSDTVCVAFSQSGDFSSIEFGDRDAFEQIGAISISEDSVENGMRKMLIEDVFPEGRIEIEDIQVEDRFIAFSTENKMVVVTKASFELRDLNTSGDFDTSFILISVL